MKVAVISVMREIVLKIRAYHVHALVFLNADMEKCANAMWLKLYFHLNNCKIK